MLLAQFLMFAEEGQPANAQGPPPWFLMGYIALVFVLFYFLVALPARRKERREREALFSKMKKNDEVVTSAGIIVVLVSMKDNEDEATLRIDDNTRIRVLKSSIVRVVNSKEAAK